MEYTARYLSPILPVADMETSIRFYVDVLGFEVIRRSDEYSIVRKDAASLHLARAADGSVIERTRGHMSVYLEVAEIVPLWAQVCRSKGPYKVRDLFDRDYGMREFHICDPDDCLIFVGERI